MNNKRSNELFMLYALVYIEKIKRFSMGIKTERELEKKDFLFDAIVRSIKVLCETINYILQDNVDCEPFNGDCLSIAGFKSVLDNYYFDIDLSVVLKIVTTDIFEFEKEFLEFLDKIKYKCDLLEAFESIKIDLKKYGRQETLNYLIDIENKLKSKN